MPNSSDIIAEKPLPKKPLNLWPWSPLFVIGAAVIANVVMFLTANAVHPEKVEDKPFVASSRIDGEKIAAEHFVARGFVFSIKARSQLELALTITNNTTITTPATVYLYCPSDAASDLHINWENPTQPLIVHLTKPGMWRLRVDMRDENGSALRSENAIDSIAVTTP